MLGMPSSLLLAHRLHCLRLQAGCLGLVMLIALLQCAQAGTVSAATGGSAISADTAATCGSGSWTSLSGPSYAETVNGDLNNGTVVLTAPTGFQFNTASTVRIRLLTGDSNANKNMNNAAVGGVVATATVTASTITFSVFSKSQGNTLNSISWEGIQVRPSNASPTVSGNIVASGTSGIAAVASSSNFGSLATVDDTRLYTVLPGQTFVAGTGVTGTPTAQTAGSAFNLVELVAADGNFNISSCYSGSKTISYSGPASCLSAPSYTTTVNFSGGRSSTTLSTTLPATGSTSISAQDVSGGLPAVASSSFTVNVGTTVSRLVVTLPGQTFNVCSGNSGTPSTQTVNVPFNLTRITATDSNFNIIASYSGSKALSYSGPAGSNSYTSPVSFTSGQSTTALATTITQAQTTQISVSDGTVSGPASSSFVVQSSGPSSFNAFDSSESAATTSGGYLRTRVAGSSFAFDVVALTSGPAVMTTFVGNVKLELVNGSSGVCAAMPVIQTLPVATFAAPNNGRLTISGVVENNAWQNVRVRMSYPAAAPSVISCSANNFAIRPASFSVVASDTDANSAGTVRTLNNAAAGGVVHRVDMPFTLRISPLNALGTVTSNYTGTPTVLTAQCGTAMCAAAQTLNTAAGPWTNSSGVLQSSTVTYGEIGAVNVTAEDSSFAVVDAADPSPTSATISSSATTIGRFIPHQFVATAAVLTPRSDSAGCAASSFSYMGEPFALDFTLRAVNSSGTTLSSYAGSLAQMGTLDGNDLLFAAMNDAGGGTAFNRRISAITRANPAQVTTATAHGLSTGARIYIAGVAGMTEVNGAVYTVTVVDATRFTLGVDSSAWSNYSSGGHVSRLQVSAVSGSWVGGTAAISATLQFLRQAVPDGPYSALRIGILPQDADGVTLSSVDLDSDQDGSADRLALAQTQLRFGIVRLANAYGSERLPLPVPLTLAYWNGSGFVANTLDNCTTFSAANVQFSAYRGGITSSNMSTANIQLGAVTAGTGSLRLTRPLPQPSAKGSVSVRLDLAAENKTWLRGRWSSSSYDADPTANAAFGLYRPGRVLFIKEIF